MVRFTRFERSEPKAGRASVIAYDEDGNAWPLAEAAMAASIVASTAGHDAMMRQNELLEKLLKHFER